MNRSVLVAGATGHQGGAVADALMSGEYGHFDVRALTRRPDSGRAQALANRGATIVKGNLLDKDSLVPAVEAVEAVYCVTTFEEDGFDAEVEQGTNMAEVASAAEIEQFVFSSVAGVERDTRLLHIESKAEIEQRIRELGLPATILRPVFFMQNFENQRETILNGTLAYPLAERVSWQLSDAGDIGDLAAIALANPEEYVGEVIGLVGDEHTLESAAEVFTTVTGTEVAAQHVPISVARAELIEELGEEIGEDLARMFEWLNDHGFEDSIEEPERDHEFEPARLETYLRQHGWER